MKYPGTFCRYTHTKEIQRYEIDKKDTKATIVPEDIKVVSKRVRFL